MIRLCLSLSGSERQILEDMQADADLFEIRLDLSEPLDLQKIRACTSKPLIMTAHGRPELLRKAAAYANYIDVGPGTGVNGVESIVSYHAKEGDPNQLWSQFCGDHITKIVLETEDYDEIAQLVRLNAAHHPNALCFAMGETGAFSRVLAALEGAPWIYCSPEGRPTAPGQFTMQELISRYRIRRDMAADSVQVFGIVGQPVSHSRSPEFHNGKFAENGTAAVYLPFPCTDLKSLIKHAEHFRLRGLSITHPLKEQAATLADVRTAEVEKLKSCNTLTYRDGRWYGDNTDIAGIKAMIREAPFEDARVVILGAGSSARAVAHVVRNKAREILFLNRTLEKAAALAFEFGGRSGTLRDFDGSSADVIIQTTPVGLQTGDCPIDPSSLGRHTTVFEAIYNPAETELLRRAKAAGCRTVNGESWFLAQADAQSRLWMQDLKR